MFQSEKCKFRAKTLKADEAVSGANTAKRSEKFFSRNLHFTAEREFFRGSKRMKKTIAQISLCVFIFSIGISTPIDLYAKIEAKVSIAGKLYPAKQYVKRKVLADLIAKVTNVTLEKAKKCYKDVKTADKMTPAVCALKKAKVFPVTTTNKIKPEEFADTKFTITRLCAAKKLIPSAKLLAECKTKITSNKKITYEKLAQLIAKLGGKEIAINPVPPKVLANDEITTLPQTSTNNIPPRDLPAASFSPVPEKKIETDFFNSILLSQPLPNRFYLGEVYYLEGTITDTTSEDIYTFLCRDGQVCDDSIDFVENTTDGGRKFKMPIVFSEAGNFQIGMIPGKSGQSKIADISVMPETPTEPAGTAANELTADYSAGNTTFSWNGSGSLTQLTIFQGSARVDYFFRQNIKSFSPNSTDFVNFKKGGAAWFVTQNSARSQIKQISITTMEFRKIDDKNIKTIVLQEFFTKPTHFSYTGKALDTLSNKAALTLPNGKVEEFDFKTSDVISGTEFSIERDLKEMGTYIFEINDTAGGAVLNIPIYIGGSLPLLPDYFALNSPSLNTSPISNISTARTEMLNLINAARFSEGVNKVEISDAINPIAQAHAQNMADNNFFGHTDPQGRGPDERRKNAGYPASIRENLGKAADVEGIHMGLLRSPVHRDAIIDPTMTRVGIGFAKNSEGYLLAVENFSADPITPTGLIRIENELFAAAAQKRIQDGLPVINHNTILRDAATQWSNNMKDSGFFAPSDGSGNSLVNLVRSKGINSTIQIHIIKASDEKLLTSDMLSQSGLSNSQNINIGIGLSVNNIGELYATFIYTP